MVATQEKEMMVMLDPKKYSTEDLVLLLNQQMENNTKALENLSNRIDKHYVTRDQVALVKQDMENHTFRIGRLENDIRKAVGWLLAGIIGGIPVAVFSSTYLLKKFF